MGRFPSFVAEEEYSEPVSPQHRGHVWSSASAFRSCPLRVGPNEFWGNRVLKIRRSSGERLGSLEVPRPDNSSWNQHGELLVASQPMSILEIIRCTQATPEEPCLSRSSVVAIDPDTFEAREIFAHEGAPIGPATMALQHGEYLYLGTFSGDRIGRYTLGD